MDANWEPRRFLAARVAAVEAATANVQAAEEDRRGVLVSLQAEVARNYVELCARYQQQRSLAQHNLELQNQTLGLTRDRVKNGVGSELDVSRASAQVAATAADIPLWLEAWRMAGAASAGGSHQPTAGEDADPARRRTDPHAAGKCCHRRAG